MKLSACVILLAGGLAAFAAPAAFDDEHGERRSERAYENNRRHQWNAQEDRAYRQYLKERNRSYRPWNRSSRQEQDEYWRWRDSHPDTRNRADRSYRDRDDDQRRDRDRR